MQVVARARQVQARQPPVAATLVGRGPPVEGRAAWAPAEFPPPPTRVLAVLALRQLVRVVRREQAPQAGLAALLLATFPRRQVAVATTRAAAGAAPLPVPFQVRGQSLLCSVSLRRWCCAVVGNRFDPVCLC